MTKKIIFSSITFLLIILTLSVVGCKPTPKDRTAEKEARKEAFKAMYSEAYFIGLKEALELNDLQIKSLKSYNTQFKYSIRRLRLKDQLTNEKRKALRKARNTKERKAIGRPLYIKKIEFDKGWLAKMKNENVEEDVDEDAEEDVEELD